MTANLDTNNFFAGGAGFFVQYHDIIKPVYLYATISLVLSEENYGLPVNIIKDMSILSIVEWYHTRRYINPLQQLDWAKQIDPKVLDDLLNEILRNDISLYTLAPPLLIDQIFHVYRKQSFSFPIFIYSEEYEPYIEKDCNNILDDIPFTYVYGDLKECLKKCDDNYTYIFSNIELVKKAAEILIGTCSHILLARDYRYNFTDSYKTYKYDIKKLMSDHPFIRLGTTVAMDIESMNNAFDNISEYYTNDDKDKLNIFTGEEDRKNYFNDNIEEEEDT